MYRRKVFLMIQLYSIVSTLFKHTGSYGVCYKFLIPREHWKESSSLTSDSMNGLILEYLETEDRKDSRFNIYIYSH